MIVEYPKIETLYNRDVDGSKKLIIGSFRNPMIEYLAHDEWLFTEKIDGTNTRVYWDGHKVSFAGRTDRAQMPSQLLSRLNEIFGTNEAEELFEQRFGDKEVILFGEGYGAGIQKNGNLYREDNDFILFDVMVNGIWLSDESITDIATCFGISRVPILLIGTIDDAVDYVMSKPDSQTAHQAKTIEGVVGRPAIDIFDKRGKRAIVKIKVCDFC